MKSAVKRGTRVLIDLGVLTAALALAVMLRFDWDVPRDMLRRLVVVTPYVVGLQYIGLMAFGVPRFSWRFVGLREVTRIVSSVAVTSVLLLLARIVFAEIRPGGDSWARYAVIPIGVIAIDFVLALLGITGARAMRRVLGERSDAVARKSAERRVSTMLVGAGQAGLIVAKDVTSRPDLGIDAVGFLDDDTDKLGTVLHGIPVLGTTQDLARLCEDRGAEQVLITIAHASGADIRRISRLCEEAGIPTKIVPAVHEIVAGRIELNRIRPVAIEDLLRRDPVDLDKSAISEAVRHRTVLVTGAGGSIGSEVCRQLHRFNPDKLVLLERSENELFHIHRELRALASQVELVPCIADVCDAQRVAEVLVETKPDLIYHAAAHKHVPMMEWNPGEAVKNNVFGTKTVADAAQEHGVEAFVMISTDKAVRPTSIMGATKRAAELYVQALAATSQTRFVSVRFGNVLGSKGSVVPIFKRQIERGGPVTVTHPEMQRYFMTIPEACQLVMQAGTMGKRNEIFILDMGEPVKIVDLARDLIRLSGLTPDEDIEITFSGIRPGEKLFEELTAVGELDKTLHPDIMVERTPPPPAEHVHQGVEALRDAVRAGSEAGIRTALTQLIPEVTHLVEEAPKAELRA